MQYQALSKLRPLTDFEKSAQQESFEEYLDSFGLATGKNLTAAGKTLSFDQWIKIQESSPDGEKMAPESASSLSKIWDQLSAKQRQLPAKDLLSLADNWNKLAPDQWRSLTAWQTQEQLDLINEFDLDQGLSREFFAKPDLVEWLTENPPEDRYTAMRLLDKWNSLPSSIKKFDGDKFYNLLPVWDCLTPAEWEKLPDQNFDDTVKTLMNIHLWPTSTSDLLKHPDFSKWFADNNAHTLASTEELNTTLLMWDRLTPEQKQLPAEDVILLANRVALKDSLETIFGKDSTTIDYLVSLATTPGTTSPQVVEWFQGCLLSLNDTFRMQAKAQVEKLAQEKAPAESFQLVSLDNQLFLDYYWGDNPLFQTRLKQIFSDDNSLSSALRFVHTEHAIRQPLIEQAIEQGFTGNEREWSKLKEASMVLFYFRAATGTDTPTAAIANLVTLQKQGLNLDELAQYMEENPDNVWRVKSLLESNPDARQLRARNLADRDELKNLQGFSSAEMSQIDALQTKGLSVTRLSNHLADKPEDLAVFHELLAQDAGVKQITDFMRLAVFPTDVNLKLIAAITNGDIKAEDVLGKLRNWHSGPQFRDLLISQVNSGASLSKARLDIIQSKAANLADTEPATTALPPGKRGLPLDRNAESFVDAARAIQEKIPFNKPIVLLGRDAWPLLPLLRQAGRDVHYFLWSRLQVDDDATKKQWLKEIPPDAAVIDSGFSGSIIDQIKMIDPGASGYLMSSRNDEKYPTLLSFPDHSFRVDDIEKLPKLIYRSSKHTEQGGAVSRIGPDNTDSDTDRSINGSSRWRAEHNARELLRAAGLPAWDVWRYSQFVGLTPMERLGFDSKDQLTQHYNAVAQARAETGPAH